MTGRWDVTFHDPALWRVTSANFPTLKLKDLVFTFSGGTPPKSEPSYWFGSIPWASPKDFNDFEITDTEDCLTEDGVEAAKLQIAKPGSVLVVVRSGILKHTLPVSINTCSIVVNQDVKVLIPRDNCSGRFLAWYLTVLQDRILPLIVKHSTTVQSVNTKEFEQLKIPLPPLQKQLEFVAALDEARSQRKQKIVEADALLSSLDDYLLNTLGLDRPAEDKRKVFGMRVQDIRSQGRLNSDYFHPERILALRAITAAAQTINCQRLEDVVHFVRDKIKTPGDNYLGLAHVQSNTGELTNVDDIATGDCFTFQIGDVLFARLRPYLNKVYRTEMDGCCSPEFHVLRIRDNNLLLPDYLAVILRSRLILAQTIHMMTGNTHPRLANDDVTNLVIPIPSFEIQQQISEEMCCRRNQARCLRSEAEAVWQEAKKWFEGQLLGATTL